MGVNRVSHEALLALDPLLGKRSVIHQVLLGSTHRGAFFWGIVGALGSLDPEMSGGST